MWKTTIEMLMEDLWKWGLRTCMIGSAEIYTKLIGGYETFFRRKKAVGFCSYERILVFVEVTDENEMRFHFN